MRETKEHGYIPVLKRQLADHRIDRREFLRSATLLGMSAGAAYAFAGKLTGGELVAPAQAQTALPKGGTLRIGMRCQDLISPHTYQLGRIVEFRPPAFRLSDGHRRRQRDAALAGREMGAAEDLKTWTLHLRKDVKWHNGRAVHRRRRRLEPQARARSEDRLLGARPDEELPAGGVRDRREGRQGQRRRSRRACGTPTRSRRSTTSP